MFRAPIIQSLLDLDFYKLTMAQIAWKYYSATPVKYSFKNRTQGVNLGDAIKEDHLRGELEHVSGLRFKDEELQYLENLKFGDKPIFDKRFLRYLKHLKLEGVAVQKNSEGYSIDVTGSWPKTILWETLILSIVNELYYRNQLRDAMDIEEAEEEGLYRLRQKILTLEKNPDIAITDFGTRRRFSHEWQEFVLEHLKLILPRQLTGTSNVFFAKKFGIKPIGTFAHEMYMIFSGIYSRSDEEIRASHNKVLECWFREYGEALSIALTDTYGTDFFFKDFTKDQAEKWRGLRHDSGDPIAFGEKAITFYQSHSIDPKRKLIVFSDGLDIETIVKLHNHFKGRIQTGFGWGTNLTNDLGFKPLSLVVKAVEADGHGLVKLSDNIAKAVGKPEDIKRFKKIFDYTNILNESCKY